MKELKIILLLLAFGFSSSGPATPKNTNTYYPNTIKGGLQTSQNKLSKQVVVVGVEGDYEYYIQFIKFKLDYKKYRDEQADKKAVVSPECIFADTLKVSC